MFFYKYNDSTADLVIGELVIGEFLIKKTDSISDLFFYHQL